MGLYETTFIVNPQTDDATIDHHVKEITDIISEGGGKIMFENRMGTRRMAYAINGLTQGYYANFIFEAPNTVLPPMERHFRLGEAYLRNLTVVFEGPLPDKDAPPALAEDFHGRPRGGSYDRPFGRRESYDRGRPESRPPVRTAPKEAPAAGEAASATRAAEATPKPPPVAPPVVAAPVPPPVETRGVAAPAPATAAPRVEAAPAPAPAAPRVEPAPEPPAAKPKAPQPVDTAPAVGEPAAAETPATKPDATTPEPTPAADKPAEEETYREEEEL